MDSQKPKARRLTFKQQKFATEYIKNGGNGTQAVLKVYNANPQTARQMASDNLANPDIRQRIDEALANNGLTPATITKNIGNLASSEVEKVSADAKLKANVELLKLMGAYPGTKHTNVSLSIKGKLKDMKFQDAKAELESIRTINNEVLEEVDAPPQAQDVG